jgi:hypothetical protein
LNTNGGGSAFFQVSEDLSPSGGFTGNAMAALPAPADCSASGFFVKLSAGPDNGIDRDFALFKNGSNTGISCQISGTDTSCSDTGTPVEFVAGDSMSIRSAIIGTDAAAANARFGFICTKSDR